MDRSELAETFARVLGVTFPQSYRTFLLNQGTTVVGGHRILGLPSEKVRWSVTDATEFLRRRRDDLPRTLVAISIRNERVLCLDLARGTEEDAPLVDVSLAKDQETLPVADSFTMFMEMHPARARTFKCAVRQMKNRKAEFETGSRKKKLRRLHQRDGVQSTLHSRPQDWHPRIVRYHDDVMILTAYRYNFRERVTEVDAFFVEEETFSPGEMAGNFGLILFPEALKLGGNVEITFTRDLREDAEGRIPRERLQEKRLRAPRPLPGPLVAAAARCGLTFADAAAGRIHHDEALRFWRAILALSPAAEETIERLTTAGYATREGLYTVITAGIWTKAEAEFLFANAPRPEAVLLGTDVAEARLPHAESLVWGTAAQVGTHLVRYLELLFTEGEGAEELPCPELTLEASAPHWLLTCAAPYELPWTHSNLPAVTLEAGARLLLLPRPRLLTQPDDDREWIRTQVRQAAAIPAAAAVRAVILSLEASDHPDAEALAREAAQAGVQLVFLPRRYDWFEKRTAERMTRARRIRHFPSRLGPLPLRAFAVPENQWSQPGFSDVVKQAETFGRWVQKRVDVGRARQEITICCRAIERVVQETADCRLLATVDGQESLDILRTLAQGDFGSITIPSILPPPIAARFLSALSQKQELQKALHPGAGCGLTFALDPFVTPHDAADLPPPAREEAPPPAPRDLPFPAADPDRLVTGRREEALRLAQDMETCAKDGKPIPVSYYRPELLPEVLRSLCIAKAGVGNAPVYLRVQYTDGTEGVPFPLLALPPAERPEGMFLVKTGLVSMRHPEVDEMIHCYLLRNMEVQARKDSSAEQEELAFERMIEFTTDLLRAAAQEDVTDIIARDPYYKVLFKKLGLMEKNRPFYPGVEIHLFQTTGLEPVTAGVYRAVVRLLREYRRRFVLTPRILAKTVRWDARWTERQKIKEDDYRPTEAWY